MKIVELQLVLDGVRRKGIPKTKVKGYKADLGGILNFYTRGKIRFIVATGDTGYCSIQKFDLGKVEYLPVTYNDFHRFIDIVEVA